MGRREFPRPTIRSRPALTARESRRRPRRANLVESSAASRWSAPGPRNVLRRGLLAPLRRRFAVRTGAALFAFLQTLREDVHKIDDFRACRGLLRLRQLLAGGARFDHRQQLI